MRELQGISPNTPASKALGGFCCLIVAIIFCAGLVGFGFLEEIFQFISYHKWPVGIGLLAFGIWYMFGFIE